MNASKENAAEALKHLESLDDPISGDHKAFVQVFLEAAAKKLPSEASFAKDKKRKAKG